MEKLNKKGFTLIELLAVIVLLAIVGVVGANIIIKRVNKAKTDTFVNTYKDLVKEVSTRLTFGEEKICSQNNENKECSLDSNFCPNDSDIGKLSICNSNLNSTSSYDVPSGYEVHIMYINGKYRIGLWTKNSGVDLNSKSNGYATVDKNGDYSCDKTKIGNNVIKCMKYGSNQLIEGDLEIK